MAAAELADGGRGSSSRRSQSGGEDTAAGQPSVRSCRSSTSSASPSGDPVAFDEELARLGGRERELVGAQLARSPAARSRGEAERRVAARVRATSRRLGGRRRSA